MPSERIGRLEQWRADALPNVRRMPRTSLIARFEAKIQKTDTCWIWIGARAPNGYGQIVVSGPRRVLLAHRLSYQTYVGPIPDGLVIDHLCRVRACVRPDHLEPVTVGENSARGMHPHQIARRAGRCTKGHALTPENSYLTKDRRRICKICAKARTAAYLVRKAATRAERRQV